MNKNENNLTMDECLQAYYAGYDEEGRLLWRHGQVEYLTTMKLLHDRLKPGDRIVPRFDAINPDTYDETEYTGEEYVWGAGNNVTFGPLPDGAYLYSFVIDDIFGGSYETEYEQ